MYAVSISLGASSAYVAVAPPSGTSPDPLESLSGIKIVANSSGSRRTQTVAAFSDQEVLFDLNAAHIFPRQPARFVPSVFAYAAVSAAMDDLETEDPDLLRVVQRATGQKFKGHCAFTPDPARADGGEGGDGSTGKHRQHQRHGFCYETQQDDGSEVERFMASEELFIQLLNYIKERVVDDACGLSNQQSAQKEKNVVLTIVAPRYAFPTISGDTPREDAVQWLRDAVQASQFDDVTCSLNVIFSDEAALMAFQQVPRASLAAFAARNVLVVDWGAHSLSLTLFPVRGGLLVQPPDGGPVPFGCASPVPVTETEGSKLPTLFLNAKLFGADAVDVALAERVAAAFLLQQRRLFGAMIKNTGALQRFSGDLTAVGRNAGDEGSAAAIIAEIVPPRAMRRLRLLMEEKKIAINSSSQGASVAIEMEAFCEGVDLMDTQTLTKTKFEHAVRAEWAVARHFETALAAFHSRFSDRADCWPVTDVLLCGGMCQVRGVGAAVREAVTSAAATADGGRFVPDVSVLEASDVPSSLTSGEVSAYGGCCFSCFTGSTLAALRQAEGKSGGRRRMDAQADRRERLSYLQQLAAWDADTQEQTSLRTAVLRDAIYLYTGTAVSAAAEDARADTSKATPLLAPGTALPYRVALAYPAHRGRLALVLLVGDASAGVFAPLFSGPIVVAPPPADVRTIVLTVSMADSDTADDDPKDAAKLTLRVHLCTEEGYPALLTPLNSTLVFEETF